MGHGASGWSSPSSFAHHFLAELWVPPALERSREQRGEAGKFLFDWNHWLSLDLQRAKFLFHRELLRVLWIFFPHDQGSLFSALPLSGLFLLPQATHSWPEVHLLLRSPCPHWEIPHSRSTSATQKPPQTLLCSPRTYRLFHYSPVCFGARHESSSLSLQPSRHK